MELVRHDYIIKDQHGHQRTIEAEYDGEVLQLVIGGKSLLIQQGQTGTRLEVYPKPGVYTPELTFQL